MPTPTLDTNVLLEYWKQQDKANIVAQLFDLANKGKVDLVVSARIGEDVPHNPLAQELNRLSELWVGVTPSVARLDYWVLGRDMLGSDEFVEFTDRVIARGGKKAPD